MSGMLQPPRHRQEKFPCNRQQGPLQLLQTLPTAVLIFSAKTQFSQRHQALAFLLIPGSPMSPGGEPPPKMSTGCTEQGRAGPQCTALGPSHPTSSGGPSPHPHRRMLMLQPTFTLLPPDCGEGKREQLLLCRLLHGLVRPYCKPSQTPNDGTQHITALLSTPLGSRKGWTKCKTRSRSQETMAHGCLRAPYGLMCSSGTAGS